MKVLVHLIHMWWEDWHQINFALNTLKNKNKNNKSAAVFELHQSQNVKTVHANAILQTFSLLSHSHNVIV